MDLCDLRSPFLVLLLVVKFRISLKTIFSVIFEQTGKTEETVVENTNLDPFFLRLGITETDFQIPSSFTHVKDFLMKNNI